MSQFATPVVLWPLLMVQNAAEIKMAPATCLWTSTITTVVSSGPVKPWSTGNQMSVFNCTYMVGNFYKWPLELLVHSAVDCHTTLVYVASGAMFVLGHLVPKIYTAVPCQATQDWQPSRSVKPWSQNIWWPSSRPLMVKNCRKQKSLSNSRHGRELFSCGHITGSRRAATPHFLSQPGSTVYCCDLVMT